MPDLWESVLRTISALAIVLLLMGLAAFVARRVMGNRLGVIGPRPLVQVVASGYVAPRKMIALVSVAGEYLIVGTTATDLVPLGRLNDDAKLQELLASTDSPAALSLPSGPQSILASWLGRFSAGSDVPHKEGHVER